MSAATTTPLTTASTTRPSTSSITAAPSMIRASRLCDLSEVLQDPGGDTDARGAERGAEEGVDVRAVFREQPRPDAPTQRERSDDSGHRHEHRRNPDVEHLGHGRLETDLEEQDERTDPSEHLEGRIGLDSGKSRDSHEREIAEHDAADELAENRRLTCAYGEVTPEFGRHEDRRPTRARRPRSDPREMLVPRPTLGWEQGRERE